MYGKLYLVGTPIGNLGDLSPRAVETLKNVDFIAAEDTRVTLKLLNRFEIKKPLVSYFEHNRAESGAKIVSKILNGESCALVSDAGMPVISDPGGDLVKMCGDMGIETLIIPGPSAFVSALALSGLPAGRFTFEGFLSTSKKSRDEHLKSLVRERRTMVFYEAPHKLLSTLNDMLSVFGNRRISISREITKIHEETWRTTLKDAAEFYSKNTPKGEFVIVIEGSKEDGETVTTADAVIRVIDTVRKGTSLKDAVREISEVSGISKNLLYSEYLKYIKKSDPGDV